MLRVFALVLIASIAGSARQFLPNGISWTGKWPTAETSAEDAYKMMAQPTDPPFVSISEAIQMHEKEQAIFLDARDAGEFAAGRIPGARNLPYYDFENKRAAALEGVKADDALVIYCEGIGCELSLFLGRELQAAGFTGARIFYGGFPEWKDAGLPVEK